MYLFFDGVSSRGFIGVFSEKKELLFLDTFQIALNESTRCNQIIHDFLYSHDILYSQIKNIICVIGPGSFTGIRTISLVVNTLAYIYPHIHLTGVNFFDLFSHYPIVKSSSKRDLFVKWSESDIIEVMSNGDFEENNTSSQIYGDTVLDRFSTELKLENSIDYQEFFSRLILDESKRLAPLYIKKPNIS